MRRSSRRKHGRGIGQKCLESFLFLFAYVQYLVMTKEVYIVRSLAIVSFILIVVKWTSIYSHVCINRVSPSSMMEKNNTCFYFGMMQHTDLVFFKKDT